MTLIDILLVVLVVALVLSPLKYDPAIRLKAWAEKRRAR